jgi:hypothetical protein
MIVTIVELKWGEPVAYIGVPSIEYAFKLVKDYNMEDYNYRIEVREDEEED